MAYFAFINDENIVVEVITGKNEDEATPEGFDNWEEYYETKREDLTCKRTSFNTYDNVYIDPLTMETGDDQSKAFRGNFAGINAIYKPTEDIFTPVKPFESWVYDETIGNLGNWVAPTEKPDYNAETENYMWNEEEVTWDLYRWNGELEIYEKVE